MSKVLRMVEHCLVKAKILVKVQRRLTEVHKTFRVVWAVKCSQAEFSAAALGGEARGHFCLAKKI